MRFLRPRYSLSQLLLITAAVGAAIWWWINGAVYTGREFDIAIIGKGYLQVMDDDCYSPTYDGQFYYTRDGHLALNANGQLCVNRGGKLWVIMQPTHLWPGYTGMTIEPDGHVFCHMGDFKKVGVGLIVLATFSTDCISPLPADPTIFRMASTVPGVAPANWSHATNRPGMGFIKQRFIGTGAKRLLPPAIATALAAVTTLILTNRSRRKSNQLPVPAS